MKDIWLRLWLRDISYGVNYLCLLGAGTQLIFKWTTLRNVMNGFVKIGITKCLIANSGFFL